MNVAYGYTPYKTAIQPGRETCFCGGTGMRMVDWPLLQAIRHSLARTDDKPVINLGSGIQEETNGL